MSSEEVEEKKRDKKHKKRSKKKQKKDKSVNLQTEDDHETQCKHKIDKKKKNKDRDQSPSRKAKKSEQEAKSEWAFEVDPTDHCETPEAAYVDICPCLDKIAETLGKNRSSLAIYDPFFCKGSMGFQNVYNKNEDFYKVQAEDRIPEYDVFITNPPYSGDHIEKLLKFVVTAGKKKPWFLLMPNYVYRKPYYTAILKARGVQPILISPNQRYQYLSPLTGATSPFVSFWYAGGLGGVHKMTLSWLRNRANRDNKKKKRRGTNALGFNVALQPSQLPMNMKDSNDPTRTRLRKNQRDAKKKKTQQPAGEVKKGSSSLESSEESDSSEL